MIYENIAPFISADGGIDLMSEIYGDEAEQKEIEDDTAFYIE